MYLRFSYRVVMVLEYSQFLERYLWQHFTPERASPAYLVAIVLMVNEKWRQGVPPWQVFEKTPEAFPQFMHLLMDACTSDLKACCSAYFLFMCLFTCLFTCLFVSCLHVCSTR